MAIPENRRRIDTGLVVIAGEDKRIGVVSWFS
jgi:hypothetical protein